LRCAYPDSGCDIRGVNFSKASLIGANFAGVQAGLLPIWYIILSVIAVIILLTGGMIIGFAAVIPSMVVEVVTGNIGIFVTAISCLVAFYFLYIIFRKGIGAYLGIASVIGIIISALLLILINDLSDSKAHQNLLGSIILITLGIAFLIIGLISLSLSHCLLKILRISTTLQIFLLTLTVAPGYLLGALIGVSGRAEDLRTMFAINGLPILGLVCWIAFFNVALKAQQRDERYRLIYQLAHWLSTSRSTSFDGAKLDDASFYGANLEYTNFANASLRLVNWKDVSGIETARVINTYLADIAINKLVTSGKGDGISFTGHDLRYLNLSRCSFIKSNLSNCDLSGSILEGSNLSMADLSRTKLYGTDLREVILTGGCIQDWAISTDTVMANINCEYVYMRQPTSDDPDPWRKPDIRDDTFKEGDFIDFIAPIMKTLDLYRQQNVDPRELGKQLKIKAMDLYHYEKFNSPSALIALKKLADENPIAELGILSLEVFGEEKVHLKIEIKGQGDVATLNKKYHLYYKDTSNLSNQEIQQKLELISKSSDAFGRLISIFTLPRGDNIINISVGRDLSGVLNLGTISGGLNNK
jgi:uncharacterized protein YjbI with pentapeptide repeats